MVSDGTTTMTELKSRVQGFVNDRDWGRYHNPKDLAISIAIEASELMEIFQWVREADLNGIINQDAKRSDIQQELADVIIYCLGLANVLDIDIAQAVIDKIGHNECRYPADEAKGFYEKHTGIK